MNFIKKISRFILDASNFIERYILIWSVLIMAVNNVANVIGRFVFNKGLFFSEELNSILIVLITFAGTSYAARHAAHIRMTALYDYVSPLVKRILLIITCFITSLLFIAMCYFSYRYILSIMPAQRVMPALGIKVYWVYLWIPVSFFVTALQYFRTGVRNILTNDLHLSTRVTGENYDTIEI